MKTIFSLLFSALFFWCSMFVYSQQSYTVYIPGTDRFVFYNAGNNSYGSGNNELKVGYNSNTFRSYIYWSNIRSYIPSGSQITQVKFYITWSGQGSQTAQLEFRDFSIGSGTPQTYNNIGSGTLWGTKAATVTEYSFSQLTTKIQSAVNGGTNNVWIGIKNQNESNSNHYVFYQYNVSLEVTYLGTDVNVTQVDESGVPFGQVGRWLNNDWEYINVPFTLDLQGGTTLGLQSDTAFKAGTYQKYWKWTQNSVDIFTNHHNFTIASGSNLIRSTFKSSEQGIQLKTKVENTVELNGKIEFKDPWLIDYPDPAFGNTPRNRGMAAPFKELSTPYTFTYSSDYKGLFLEQSGPPLWTSPYYALKMPDEQPITVHNQSRKFFPYGWEETGGVTFQYPWGQQTGVVFNSSNNVATAVLKGQLMSKEQTGISSNSQRKMVRTDNGIYHVVYESMGSVWYTHSLTTNYFGNWSTDFWAMDHAKNPSLDYEGNTVLIVCEYYDPALTTDSELWLFTFNPGGGGLYSMTNYESFASYPSTYFGNAKPVIAFTSGQIFIVYRKNATEGLKERTKWNISGNWSWASEASIPQTNSNSTNPAVAGKFGNMHIVFESLATIQYKFAYNQGPSWRYNDTLNLSSGSGFNQNYYPSISISVNSYVMVSWQGVYTFVLDKTALKSDELSMHRFAAVARVGYGTNWGGFSNFSNNVKYTNNNSINAVAGSILSWSENNGQVSKYVKRRANGLYDPIGPLSTNGIHPIISNGSGFENIKAMVFNTSTSAPYLLNRCNNDFNIELLQKEATEQLISYGRSGVVEKDGIEFLFNIGDVNVNSNTIKFIERVDTLPVTSIEEMNLAAVTETFNLNSSIELIFSNYYYVVNKNLADSVLNENFNLTFKSELVKAQGNEVVGTFDVVTYDIYNLDKYANLSYLVDCSGIESGEYFMRLTTIINEDVNLYISDIQRDDIVLEKAHLLTRNFKGESIPVTYSLEQNFPNPFNPSTTIRYQLPQDGMVTLKVYDILGSEVATLVNEQKAAGRYEVNFDATRLASGVYIYKLTSGTYVNSKKMLLVK